MPAKRRSRKAVRFAPAKQENEVKRFDEPEVLKFRGRGEGLNDVAAVERPG